MKILIVTGIEGAENCVGALSRLLDQECELAAGRKPALIALKRNEFAAVVVDQAVVDCDPAGVDVLWQNCGLAMPLQVSFAVSGVERLAREIRMALGRRERERTLARDAAAAAIESELKSTVAGLLLHSQLALADREITQPLAEKIRVVAELAGTLRQQLSTSIAAGQART